MSKNTKNMTNKEFEQFMIRWTVWMKLPLDQIVEKVNNPIINNNIYYMYI